MRGKHESTGLRLASAVSRKKQGQVNVRQTHWHHQKYHWLQPTCGAHV